jgi:hypothetical protein
MQFRLISAFLIFIGSYFPLAIILAVQDIPLSWWSQSLCDYSNISRCQFIPFQNPWLAIGFFLATLFSIILSCLSLGAVSFPFPIEVTSSKGIPNELINYVFPYLVSFMGISYETPEKLFGFLVFLLWMFAITYKSGQIIMNPLLLMFGWKLYEANIRIEEHEREVRVLIKGSLSPGSYQAQTIQDFYIARKS